MMCSNTSLNSNDSFPQSCTHYNSSALCATLIFLYLWCTKQGKSLPIYHLLINSGLLSCIKSSLHIKCRRGKNVCGPQDGPRCRLQYGGRKRKHDSEFRCLRAVQSQPCLFLLWLCGGSSSRLAASCVHVDLGNSGRPHLCVVLSPLWGALHYFPTATSEYPHIPLTFLPSLPRTGALHHNPPPPHIFSF